ncbi:MAG: DUF4352 domain-containing protein [Brooklawnia sp.]
MEHRPDQSAGSGAVAPGGGGRRRFRPALLAAVVLTGIVLAGIVFLFTRPGYEPSPATPSPLPGSPTATPSSGETHQTSTRSPLPTVTRTEPRTGIAPLVGLGETVEYLDEHGSGLITVLDAQWLPSSSYRHPAEGYAFLGVQIELEAIRGSIEYAPAQASMRDAGDGPYSFIVVSGFTDHPQFISGTLAAGEVMKGWVLFELPPGDATFTWSSDVEQAIRVAVDGGGPAERTQPEITLNQSLTEVLDDVEGTVTVEGVSWTTQTDLQTTDENRQFVAVKLRIRAGEKPYAISPFDFEIELADGTTISRHWTPAQDYQPELGSWQLPAGDELAGWLLFEVPREDCVLVVSGNVLGEALGRIPIPASATD